MKGNYQVRLKNGKFKKFKYYGSAIKAYFSEYGYDIKNIDKVVVIY